MRPNTCRFRTLDDKSPGEQSDLEPGNDGHGRERNSGRSRTEKGLRGNGNTVSR